MPKGRIEYYFNSGSKYTLTFTDDTYEHSRKLFDEYSSQGFECQVKVDNFIVINLRCVEKVNLYEVEDK